MNVIAPSANAISEDNDVTDCGINIIVPSSSDNIATSVEINATNNELNEHTTTPGSPSSDTLVVNVDITYDETNVTPSSDINIPSNNDEVTVNVSTM